ncbi:MAG: helix-turn-helix domain-containing protein [Limnospira sp.]
MELQKAIATIVNTSGIRPAEWARRSHMTRSHLGDYINGHRDLRGSTIQKILWAMTPDQRQELADLIAKNGSPEENGGALRPKP